MCSSVFRAQMSPTRTPANFIVHVPREASRQAARNGVLVCSICRCTGVAMGTKMPSMPAPVPAPARAIANGTHLSDHQGTTGGTSDSSGQQNLPNEEPARCGTSETPSSTRSPHNNVRQNENKATDTTSALIPSGGAARLLGSYAISRLVPSGVAAGLSSEAHSSAQSSHDRVCQDENNATDTTSGPMPNGRAAEIGNARLVPNGNTAELDSGMTTEATTPGTQCSAHAPEAMELDAREAVGVTGPLDNAQSANMWLVDNDR